MTNDKIKARIILEMLGRPKEHLVDTMQKLVEALAKEKGIVVSQKEVHEPRKMEDKNNSEMPEDKQLFTTFAEVDIEVADIVVLMGIVFRYMPSHVEIVSPETLVLENFSLNTIINELANRLHYYDSVAKSAIMNNNLLAAKIKDIANKTGYTEPKAEEASSEKLAEEQKEEPKESKKKKR